MQRSIPTVIIPTALAVASFKLTTMRLGGFKEVKVDEVLARIVAALNAEGWRLGVLGDVATDYCIEGANFKILDEKILRDTQVLKGAIVTLGVAVQEQMTAMGMLQVSGGYGYFYKQLLGNDLVVTRHPSVETRNDSNPGRI